ncbi:MAG: ABC transporter substrate-binding protein [Anaerolineae bacterium]
MMRGPQHETPQLPRRGRRITRPLHRIALLLLTLLPFLAAGSQTGCRRPTKPSTMRFAVLPILDALPVYVAAEEGYFAEEGLDVELIPAASAAERDQLLQADQVDGVITDLVALALYNRERTQVVAVRYAMVPTREFPQFRILGAAGSGRQKPSDLRNVPVGVSEGTVIEYVTDRLLMAEGLDPDDIAALAVPKIPERMALLNSGELQAATLPEPLATLAMEQGARVVADDSQHPELSASIFAFTADLLEKDPEAVTAFVRAVDGASAAINADKTRWATLLAERNLIPPSLSGTYTLPDYPAGGVPSPDQLADVGAWLIQEGRLEVEPIYDEVVDTSYAE